MGKLYQIKNEQDINELLNAYSYFHDACITQINYISGSYVNEAGAMGFGNEKIKIVFNSQAVKKALELTFSNVVKMNIRPLHDALIDCTLMFDGDCIIWADSESVNKLDSCTYIIARNLEWEII